MFACLLLCVSAIAGGLELGHDVRFIEELALDDDGLSATVFDDGLLFPVRLDEALVGWVAVGPGTLTFDFEASWQAERFANTLAVVGGAAPDEVAPAVRTGRWTEPVDVMLALSADPTVSEVVARSKPVIEDRNAIGYTDDDGIFTVVVSPIGLNRARQLARKAIGARRRALAAAGVDPLDMLAVDRVEPGPSRVLLDTRTERSWKPFVEPADTNLHERWLSAVIDPSGQVEAGLAGQVFVLGVSDDGEATPRWATLASWRGAPARLAAGRHQANVVLTPGPGGRLLNAEVEQALTVVAGEHGAATIPLVQRYAVYDGTYGLTPAENGYTPLSVYGPDGQPLERLAGVFGIRPDDGASAGVDSGVWRLPEPLAPGERVQLRLRHGVQWWTAHQLEVKNWVVEELQCRGVPACSDPRCTQICAQAPEYVQLGHVAAARPVVAQLPGQRAHPVTVRVGTALPATWNVVVTGGRTEHFRVGDGRWWEAETDSRARVTVARDRGESTAAARGLPGVHVLGAGDRQAGQVRYLRSILNFYGQVFPGMPVEELDLVRDAERPVVLDPIRPIPPPPPEVEAHPGQVVVRGLREIVHPPQDQSTSTQEVLSMQGDAGGVAWTRRFLRRGMRPTSVERWLDNSLPRHVERELARAVAAQWFLQHDLLPRDRWLAQVVPAWLRDRFTEEAWGAELLVDHARYADNELREVLPLAPSVPLTAPDPWTEHLGPRWMAGLQARIGEAALNRAVARVLGAEPPSTEALREALSEGRDASHWVDFWVHGGVRPAVRAAWTHDDEQLQVTVTSDVPFGRMDVPLGVVGDEGEELLWVTVEEGRGTVVAPWPAEVKRVRVDPQEWLPLRRERTSKQAAQ